MRRYLRTIAYTLVMLGVIVGITYRMRPLTEAPDTGEPAALGVWEVETTLASLGERVAAEPRTAVVLGDSSLLDHFTLPPEKTLAAMLERDGAPAGVPLRVFAAPGFDAVAYYLLADALVALRPGAVVLIANLQTFSNSWFRNLKIKHPDLVAFVRPTRALEVIALPLDEAGISDASALTMPLLRWLRVPELPAMLRDYRDAFRAGLDGAAGAPAKFLPAFALGPRGSSSPQQMAPADDQPSAAEAARLPFPAPPAGLAPAPSEGSGPPSGPSAPRSPGAERLPEPPAGTREQRARAPATWVTSPFRRVDLYPHKLVHDAPAVRVMAAAVRALTARGLRTIVVLAPLHVQALRLTGSYNRLDVPGAVAIVRAVSLESGGEVIDLTEVLPKETYFADAYTHFTEEGNRLVAGALVGELAGVLSTAGARPDDDR